MAKEQTGIAGEFWFFCQLHRLGYKAYITLGNTKSVDLAVHLSDGRTLTFDVKSKKDFGASYRYLNIREDENHYYAFVNLEIKEKGNKRELGIPSCYIMHSSDVKHIGWEFGKEGKSDYGFEAKLLLYLKEQKQVVTQNLINRHKERHHLTDIDFNFYDKIIWTLEDFEEQFYELK